MPLCRLGLIALLVLPPVLAAQETPTQRTAAADVVRRLGELRTTIDATGLARRLTTARSATRDAVVERTRQLWETELQAMSDDLTRHPEIGFQERRSVQVLVDWLRAHDFDVTVGVADLATAFKATYRKGTPGPNLGVIVEYDALRGTVRD
ncbi:MAG: hypothetical protein RLZZ467_180, partial [Gemmatimonadota bacterium]